LLLGACGGGDGGGIGGTGAGIVTGPNLGVGGGGGGGVAFGTGISYGTVQGFGSVIVNGVHYEDRGVDIVFDDRTIRGDGGSTTQDNLRVGMVVRVDFDSASSVKGFTVDSALSGRVESVLDANRFVLMGQTIRIDDTTTRYEDNVSRTGLVPAVGDTVRVQGLVSGSGAVTAGYLQKLSTASGQFEAKGVVANHNGTNTFSIGTLTVNYSTAATTSDMPAGNWNGLVVEVKGSSCSGANSTACGALAATKVQLNGPVVSASTTKTQAEFEGTVTSGTAASFKLGNLTVTTDGSTRWEAGAAIDLATGVKVEAEGSITNGTLKASKVSFKDGARAEGDVATFSSATSSFTLNGLPGVTVKVNSLTEWKNGASLGALGVGNHLRIRGRLNGTTLTATEVELRGANQRVELQAPLTAVAAPSITLGGVTVNTTGLSDNSFLGLNDAAIGRSAFFLGAKVNTLVKVRGNLSGSTVNWSEVQLESD
jgi:cytoskeletal protein CcmA (bactofilin family)